jgi:hypothetical protein
METKALVCDIEPGKPERGPAALAHWKEHMEQPA